MKVVFLANDWNFKAKFYPRISSSSKIYFNSSQSV